MTPRQIRIGTRGRVSAGRPWPRRRTDRTSCSLAADPGTQLLGFRPTKVTRTYPIALKVSTTFYSGRGSAPARGRTAGTPLGPSGPRRARRSHFEYSFRPCAEGGTALYQRAGFMRDCVPRCYVLLELTPAEPLQARAVGHDQSRIGVRRPLFDREAEPLAKFSVQSPPSPRSLAG